MSLEAGEAKVAYESLSGIMRDAGLDWLVSDVERQILLGKPKREKITFIIPEPLPDSRAPAEHDVKAKPKKPKEKSINFVVAEEYNEIEQLNLLVDAVDAVSRGLSMAAMETLSFLKSKLKNFSAVEFAQDIKDGKVREFPIDFQSRKKTVTKLAGLLGKVRRTVL